MIGPELARDPFKSVEAVGRIVTVDFVVTLGAIASAPILIDGGIARSRAKSEQPLTEQKRISDSHLPVRVRKAFLICFGRYP